MKKLVLVTALTLSLGGVTWADEPADVFKAKCKSCHGADGRGDTKVGKKEKVKDMTSAEWQDSTSDEEIGTIIAEGSKNNSKMKAFKGKLTDAQIDGLVAYIRAMKK